MIRWSVNHWTSTHIRGIMKCEPWNFVNDRNHRSERPSWIHVPWYVRQRQRDRCWLDDGERLLDGRKLWLDTSVQFRWNTLRHRDRRGTRSSRRHCSASCTAVSFDFSITFSSFQCSFSPLSHLVYPQILSDVTYPLQVSWGPALPRRLFFKSIISIQIPIISHVILNIPHHSHIFFWQCITFILFFSCAYMFVI